MHDLRLFQSGSPIAKAWGSLARHADACDVCLPYMQRLVESADPQRTDFEVYDELCEWGKGFFLPWRAAKDQWLEGTRATRRLQFITDEQLRSDGVSFESRSAAVMSMPAKEYRNWLALPNGQRHAQLLALEAGLRHASNGHQSAPHRCEACGKAIPPKLGRFCSRACRLDQR